MTITNRFTSLAFPSLQKIVGNIFFVIILIYSIVYAAERVTYIDSAWVFFKQVNNESFAISWERFTDFFSEILLFISIKIHLPFNFLIYIFSTQFILLYYVIWRICTYYLKNPTAGLIIILGMTLGVRETFLHTVTETHQVVIFSAVLFAILQYEFNGNKNRKYFWGCFVTLLVLFSHPIGIFTLGFVLLYCIVHQKKVKDPLVIIIGLMLVVFAAWSLIHPANPYDAAQFDRLSSSSTASSFFNSAALNFISIHFTHFYWLPELAGLIVIVWLSVKKEWLKLAAVTISVIGYFIIACITFKNGDSSIMLERIFLPAFFMINLVLADLLFQEKKINKWILSSLVVFFIFNGIHYINAGCLMYKKRVAYLDEIVKAGMAQGNDTYFLSDSLMNKEKILVPWAIGTETLIYSKFKYDRCISISIKDQICSKGSCRLTTMLCLPINEFNTHYFKLSGNEYQELRK